MNIKRIILGIAGMSLSAIPAIAVPAYPYPVVIKQADGSELTIVRQGDEHRHVTLTADGYPLVFKNGNYEYAKVANGKVVGSGMVADDVENRSAGAVQLLKGIDSDAVKKEILSVSSEKMKAKGPQRIRINDFPTIGEQHSLVILVQFSDKKFSSMDMDAKDFYTRMLNEEKFTYSNGADGSARDFYMESSNGRFVPTFDVAGPVTLSKSYSYYGEDGFYGSGDQTSRLKEFMEEACTLAASEIDYSKYDLNKDGVVDNIFFFYAGYGQADGGPDDSIWPHAFSASDLGLDLEFNGVKMGSYACSNEISGYRTPVTPNGIGTFVHEFGHVLGLPDHYATDYSSGFTPGSWDAMDHGSYNNNGNTPPAFSAYERAELGWLEYSNISDEKGIISLEALSSTNNKGYLVPVDGRSSEFYVIENRQQKGWDKYIPGHGLLVWHIDQYDDVWNYNTVNNTPYHQCVDIEEADKTKTEDSRDGDSFPGTANVTEFPFNAWSGVNVFAFDGIMEHEGVVRFKLKNADAKLDSPLDLVVKQVEDSSFVFTWKSPDANTYYYKYNVFKINGDDSAESVAEGESTDGVNEVKVEGLEPDTNYEIRLYTSFGSSLSDAATTTLTTKELIFEKRRPVATVSKITKSGFSAAWEGVDNADSYEISLVERSYSSETTPQGYGFDDQKDGLPSLWKVNGISFSSTTGNFGKAAPSVKMDLAANPYILVAYPESKISTLSFWCRSYRDGNGNVVVERASDGEWSEVANFVSEAKASIKTFEFEASDSVRIRFERTKGYLLIDDVEAGCNATTRIPVEGYTNKSVGSELAYEFDGLTFGKTYGFTVRAKSGEKLSASSNECIVKLTDDAGVADIETEENLVLDSSAEIYDLNGRRLSVGNLQKGIYIVRKGNRTFKYIKLQ